MDAESRRVVAIDDDPNILKLIASVLGSAYSVETFETPRDAVEALRGGAARGEEPPALILCDVMMPEMTGFDVHEALRQAPSLRGVPFMYLTALADRSSLRRGMLQGADDYLTKPFTLAELRDAVRVRIERSSVQRDAALGEMAIASLGGVGISVGGRRLQWEAKRAAELLLYLVDRSSPVQGAAEREGAGEGGLEPTSVPLRELRADLYAEPVSDNSLRVLVNRLRKAVDGVAEVLSSDGGLTLRYEGRIRWDAREFERAAEAALGRADGARVEDAIGQYGGEFLPAFDSPWAESRRARLEELYVRLLEAAVELAGGPSERQRAEARLEAFLG